MVVVRGTEGGERRERRQSNRGRADASVTEREDNRKRKMRGGMVIGEGTRQRVKKGDGERERKRRMGKEKERRIGMGGKGERQVKGKGRKIKGKEGEARERDRKIKERSS